MGQQETATLQREERASARVKRATVEQRESDGPVDELMMIQRTAGNQAASALARADRPPSTSRLEVGPAGDAAELEAESVTDRVVHALQRSTHTGATGGGPGDGRHHRSGTLPLRQIQRSSMMVQRWWPGGKKAPAKVSGPTNVKINGNDPKQELMSQGYDLGTMPDTAPAKPAKAFGGKGGQLASTTEEVGKPGFAVSASIGAGATTQALASGGAMGAGGLALGALSAGDALVGLNNARKMSNEAELYGDKAMSKAAGRKAKDQAWVLGMGAASTAKGVAGVTQFATGAAATGTAAMAGAGLGVVAGGAMVLQGAWRGGQAVMKLCRLTWGRAQEVLSPQGARWKQVIVGAEKFKLAVNALKIAAGGLGVAAGALLLVSNPVGWALGIAAAIGAGVYALSKVAGKVSNASDKGTSKANVEKQAELAKTKVGGPKNATKDGAAIDPVKMGYDPAKTIKAGPQNAKDRGTGFAQERTAKGPEDPARKEAIEKANAIARDASANAAMAAEMRDSLSHGSKDFVFAALQAKVANPKGKLLEMITNPDDRALHDAFVLLSAINVDPDQALADSGQDLIEKKLSKAESM